MTTQDPDARLIAAVHAGDAAAVRAALDAGADVHQRGAGGATALHLAAQHGPADVVQALLNAGARNWIADDTGRTPVDVARVADHPDRDRVIALLTTIRIDRPAFRAAVAAMDAGDIEALVGLLDEHPSLARDRAEEDGAFAGPYFRHPTLLHFVANNPNRSPHMPPRTLDAARAILDAGAAVDAVTEADNGGTTLALVASSQPAATDGLQTPLIELLVSRGADPQHGLTAAVVHGYLDIARHLLALGARPTAFSAAGMGDTAALRQRLQEDPPLHDQCRAAEAAAMHGQLEALEILLDAGLDPSSRLSRPFGPTLLHQAAWSGHEMLVRCLLAHGADPTLRDMQYNGTPSDWARHNGHAQLADLLAAAARGPATPPDPAGGLSP